MVTGTRATIQPEKWEEWPSGLIIALACLLYALALLTLLGNAMVIHAIRTERKLRTVRKMRFTISYKFLQILLLKRN